MNETKKVYVCFFNDEPGASIQPHLFIEGVWQDKQKAINFILNKMKEEIPYYEMNKQYFKITCKIVEENKVIHFNMHGDLLDDYMVSAKIRTDCFLDSPYVIVEKDLL